MSLLRMENVNLQENGHKIIDNVNLSIEKGSMTVFQGPPGCGKSTALKILAGLILPTSGTVFFENSDIHKMKAVENLKFRKRCGFMFQDSALWANQDIYHNLELPLQIHFPQMSAEEKKEKIMQMAKVIKYEKPLNFRPVSLSIGEQKKVSFARAIICNPDVLFLDEPTESIDSDYLETFMNMLHDFSKQGKTIIIVSHDNYFISSFFFDKIYFDKGRIINTEIFANMLI